MDVFWNTIAAYNAATWPVQLLLVAVAAVLTLWSMGYYMRMAWPQIVQHAEK